MMQEQQAAYWNERARKYGHTGWSDNVIYAYDQQVRKLLLEYILTNLYNQPFQNALDYGCGTGDMARVLVKHCDSVTGFDISEDVLKTAIKHTSSQNIRYTSNRTEVLSTSSNYDIILTVTVLAAILDEEEFSQVLSGFSNVISSNGIFVSLETLTEGKPQTSVYNILRNKKEYLSALELAGFKITQLSRFYSPGSKDVPECQVYLNNPFVKILGKLHMSKTLNAYARNYLVPVERYLMNDDVAPDIGTYLVIARKA